MIFKVERKIPGEALRHLSSKELKEAAVHSALKELGVEVAKKKATITTFEDTNGDMRIVVRMAAMTVKDYNTLYTSLETLTRNTKDITVMQTLEYALQLLRGDTNDNVEDNKERR